MELGVKLASIFFSMILVNNYVLVKFLGICPFLGVSKKLDSAVGMSCAVIFVMVLATLVTFPIQIFLLDANDLGYLQTIVFILGRAEMFACKNNVVDSALDGLGMGLGFTLALTLMATVREILGSGTWLGIQIIPKSIPNFTLMTSAPGGFFTFGCLMALVVWFETKTNNKIDRKAGCCAEKGE